MLILGALKQQRKTFEWLTREYGLDNSDFRILQGDASKIAEKVGLESVDCIVSEPDLGPALREVPTGPYAQKIIEKLEPLFFEFIEEAYRALKPKGRLVLVTPFIKTRSKEAVTMLIGDQLERVGFKRIYAFPVDIFSENLEVGRLTHSASLVEMDERHIIGREIHILEK